LLRTNWLQQLFMICCRLLSLSINWCRDRKRDRRLLLWFLNILRFLCNWFLNYWPDAVMNQCWFLLASGRGVGTSNSSHPLATYADEIVLK
jgi:hypothetical protein